MDPLFVTGRLGDYYLSQWAAGQAEKSPCVDWGDDLASVYGMDSLTTRTDQVGDEGFVDIGYHYPVTNMADLNGDWQVDFLDYAILASQWLGPPGVPNADIAPIGGDGVIDIDDLRVFCENWLWP